MSTTLRNFAKATLITGYGSSATAIRVNAGEGSKFPTTPFNATYWNSTDFQDPSDDPFVEIVTVSLVSGDFLTVTRGVEDTIASAKNATGKTYSIAHTVSTAVVEGNLDSVASGTAIAIDFALAQLQKVTLTHNTTLTTSNRGAGVGRSVTMFFTASGLTRTVTVNGSWVNFGSTSVLSIPSGKSAFITVYCLGNNETDISVRTGVSL